MPARPTIDDAPAEEARRPGGHRSHRPAIRAALEECIARRKRRRVRELSGKTGWDPTCSHKTERKRR